MKKTSRLEKLASGFMGAVSLVLLMNLVAQSGSTKGASRPTVQAVGTSEPDRHPTSAKDGDRDEFSRYEPEVRLDLLKDLQARPLPQFARNPFEDEVARAAAQKAADASEVAAAKAASAPPPPPSVPLKPLGFGEKSSGEREAFVSDDEQTYVLHEGESFANKFRVLQITPTFIEIEDESSRQTVQLPVPQ